MLRMPLKLKWGKKSGRYELSQEIYVLTIYVGDFSLIQCTLTTDSNAFQCVDYLCEKIDLNQAEIFGFRYQMRFNDPDRKLMRWVEMDKPLRKQLEKWACKPRQVQLAILYHTPNVFSLHDQMARSLYFMLLKLDVLNGKFNMDLEKYINLAAYSLQVENSDYDSNVHTLDFLRLLKLLPQHLCRNSQLMDDFLVRILTVYERLTGMQSSYAAFLYIVDVQQCEGYGEESFQAKDDESTEVKLGYSLEEIFVKRYNGSTLKKKWSEIKDITTSKRNIIIKHTDGTSAIFSLEDVDMARYVNMVLNWQWHYATTDAIQQKSVPMSINNLQGGIRTFGNQSSLLRHSNTDIKSTRTTNSLDMGCSTTATQQPSLSSPSSLLVNRITSSMFNVNSATQLFNSNVSSNNHQSTVHSVQSMNHQPISATLSVNCNRSMSSVSQLIMPSSLSNSSLAQNVLTNSLTTIGNTTTNLISAKTSPVYRPGIANNIANNYQQSRSNALSLPPHTPPTLPAATTNTMEKQQKAEEDWLRVEQREILKQLLAEQKLNKTLGSSPEIHMLGMNNNSGKKDSRTRNIFNNGHVGANGKNSNLMRRAHHPHFKFNNNGMQTSTTTDYSVNSPTNSGRSTNYSDEKMPLHTASTPNLFQRSKWRSTPDLFSIASTNPHVDSQKTKNNNLRNKNPHQENFTSNNLAGFCGSPPAFHLASDSIRKSSPATANNLRVNTSNVYSLNTNSASSSIASNSAPNSASCNISSLFSQGQMISSSVSSAGHPITYPIPLIESLNGSQQPLFKVYPIQSGSPALSMGQTPKALIMGKLSSTAGSLISSMEEENENTQNTSSSSSCSGFNQIDNINTISFADINCKQKIEEENLRHLKDEKIKKRSSKTMEDSKKYVLLNGVIYNNPNDFFISDPIHFNEDDCKINNNNNISKPPKMTNSDQTLLSSLVTKLSIPQAVSMEFSGIPAKRLSAGFSIGVSPENQSRNREGRKVFPYEDTRVILRPSKRNPDGYINASNIKIPIEYKKYLKYIVTQAPMRNTIDDFWQLIWESGTRIIVMLVNPHQIHKSDTIPSYWPSTTKEKQNFGGYIVKLLSSSSSKFQTTSILSLKSISSSESRNIYHLYCADFTEDGVPSSEDAFLGFIDAVNSVKRHIQNERREVAQINLNRNPSSPFMKTRSRSITRMDLVDVTNRSRAQSVENSIWRKKLSFTSNISDNSTPTPNLNCSQEQKLSSPHTNDVKDLNPNIPLMNKRKNKNFINTNTLQQNGKFYGNILVENESLTQPITVVDTDGASEAGIYILVEVLIRCIEANVNVEIAHVLRSLRQQRMCLIKNDRQYRFVYQLIISYLQRSRLI